MVHIVKTLTIEPSYNVHNVAEDNRSVESPRLRLLCTNCVNLSPLSLINVELMDVVESLLVCVNSSKNVNLAPTNNCRVPIPWLRRRTVGPVNLVPVIGQETVLEDIVHSIVAVPTTKYKHRVLENNRGVTEPV